jgi:hypothetical protein
MLVGFSAQFSPVDETFVVRFTVPVNPLTGATATVEASVVPEGAVTVEGMDVIEKSGTATL